MIQGEGLMKLLLGIALAFAVMWIVSGFAPRPFSQKALAYFDRDFLEKAFRRANLSYVSMGLEAIVTMPVLFSFVNKALKGQVFLGMQLSHRVSLSDAFWVGVVLALKSGFILTLTSLPFRLYRGYFLETHFGLLRLSLAGWLLEFLKGAVLNFFVYAIAGGVVAVTLRRFPETWPYLLTVLLFFGSMLFAYIYPSVVAPMFDTFVLLEDPVILAEVEQLASNAGMQVDKVLVMEASRKTARVNAYFTGLGKTKRVVLYDTLIANHSVEEIRLVLAHELGHWKFGHITKGIALSAVGTFIMAVVFTWVSGPMPSSSSVGSLREVLMSLILFAVLTSYIATPMASLLSRMHEIQADEFSLELTGEPDCFIATMAGLAKGNLGDVEPPRFVRWFAWTHPTTLERITMGEQFKHP